MARVRQDRVRWIRLTKDDGVTPIVVEAYKAYRLDPVIPTAGGSKANTMIYFPGELPIGVFEMMSVVEELLTPNGDE